MFFASKLIALLAQPLHWVLILMLAAMLAGKRRAKLQRNAMACAFALLLMIGWQPLPDQLHRALEQSYAEIAPDADLSGYAGVVVLGGALVSGYVAQDHSQPLLNDAAERMTAASAIARKHPTLMVVFTGGEGDFFGTGPTEAQRAAQFFVAMGLSRDRFVFEDQSRNTYENALFTAKLPGIDPNKRWLLITSAWHMPRSMATFQKAGWNVTAYPVDFRTGNQTPWIQYSLATGPEQWYVLLREYIGIAAYKLAGRS